MNHGSPSAPAKSAGSTQSLATLLGLDGNEALEWPPEELGAVWRLQLQAPLALDLGMKQPAAGKTVLELQARQADAPRSFGELFHQANPSLTLLRLTKDLGRAYRRDPNRPLPPEIATALYYLSIAVALVCHNTRITSLAIVDLEKGFAWLLGKPWLDQASHQRLAAALYLIRSNR